MTASDWLQIALFLAAAFIGAVTSWIFYRAQQKSDLNRLRDIVLSIDSEMKQLKERVSTVLTVDQSIGSIKEKLDLQKDIRDVALQVREQQARPLEKLYETVENRTSELIQGLEKSIKDEIHLSLPDSEKRDELIEKLVSKVDISAEKIDELQSNLLNEQRNLIVDSAEVIAMKIIKILVRENEKAKLKRESPLQLEDPDNVVDENG